MKFRIVKVTKDTKIVFVVEKQKQFLWWTSWSTVLVPKENSWYSSGVYAVYNTLEEAETLIREQDIKVEIVKEITI